MSDIALELQTITRSFRQGESTINVLRGVSLQVRRGELVGLVGPSGSGKSTLLQITGLLEKPTGGEVIVNGQPCARLSDDARTAMRRKHLGFVYQYHHLLPEFSAVENVIMPQIIAGMSWGRARGRALELLGALGLEDRAEHRPARLSGGEQQRVAIARAVANAPLVLLADEPTGNLDQQNSERVFTQLRALVTHAGIGGLVATHSLELARRMDRVLSLEDGLIQPL